MRCFVLGSGVENQEPRYRRQKKLGEQILLDGADGLGVQLTQRESVALEQLVEILDLPTQMLHLVQVRQADLGAAQRREQRSPDVRLDDPERVPLSRPQAPELGAGPFAPPPSASVQSRSAQRWARPTPRATGLRGRRTHRSRGGEPATRCLAGASCDLAPPPGQAGSNSPWRHPHERQEHPE